MISLNNISVHFGGRILFEDVSLVINRRDRIGLVGKNGAGKTTLMRIITGLSSASSGNCTLPVGCTVGYLPQELQLTGSKRVMEKALEAFQELQDLEVKISALTQQLSETDLSDEATSLHLAQRLHEATERHQILGGAQQEGKAEKVLLGLGFDRGDLEKPLSEFSGGWQMRVELAKILLQTPDLLMLDEPTNHLDIESIQWLESFLMDYPGAVLVVSHDRAFLDNITLRTIEISQGRIYDYKACYSDYELLREERLEQEKAVYGNQQKQIAQIERFITRFRAKNTKARQVQSRIKLLEKMEKIEVDEIDRSSIHFRFAEAPASGKVVLEASDISKSYGDKQVLTNLSFMVAKGERIAFVGRNGEGKTTLSKIITGILDYNGTLKLGHNVKIGYFAQNQAEFLDPTKTVLQTIDEVAVGEVRKQLRSILGGFLFSGDDVDKKVMVLSGGEKSRLAIARLLLGPVNLLVLDEPTNHLDMSSKDILKNAILQFGGTVIVVSHDRDFLQGLTTKVFEFRNKQIKEFVGDIYDFINQRNIRSLKELEAATVQLNKNADTEVKLTRMEWEQNKQYVREKRRLQQSIERIEKEIASKEAEILSLEAQLAESHTQFDQAAHNSLFKAYDQAKKQLGKAEKTWEQLHIELEACDNKGNN